MKYKKYHYTYKIKNKCNGKIYIGVHSTNNLDDGYLGSGSALNKAKIKYGRKNFILEILKFHPSREEADCHEEFLVSKDFIKLSTNYNLIVGGRKSYMLGINHSLNSSQKISIALKGIKRSLNTRKLMSLSKMGKLNPWYGKSPSQETRKLMSLSKCGEKHPFYGKTHSEESKIKISKSQIGVRVKEKHHRYDSRKIISFDPNTLEEKIYESKLEASRILGLKNSSSINNACRHPGIKKAGGYYWRYYGDN